MSKQTTLVLAGITAVMLLFIVVYERHTLSSGEIESRRGQVLDRFVRGRVHGIRIEAGDEVRVALVRDREAEETLDTFDVGTWTLTEPVRGPADPDAIDGVILACEGLSARRTFEHPSAEDRERFGLASPRMIVTLEVADETQIVHVGADDEDLEGTYVEVVGSDRAHLVGRDFFEALDHEADHFRSKELYPDLATRDVSRMTITYAARDGGEATEARLVLEDRRWVALAPFSGWARRATILAMLDTLLDARIARFVHQGGEALVDAPRLRLTFTARERDDQGRDTGRLADSTFVVGSACPAGEDTSAETSSGDLLAVRVDDGPIACVPADALEGLLSSRDQLRETRLLAATDDQVERVVFGAATGRETEARLEIRRRDDRWEVLEAETTRDADDQAVGEYLAALHASEAESFEPLTDEALAARGLDTPRARIRVHRSDDDELVEYIDVGVADTVGVWVRRGEEPVLARYVGPVIDLLEPAGLRFRDRSVIRREADDVLRLSITRGDVEERLATDNGAWRIETPRALSADRIATRDLVRALTTLRAVRWVAADEGATGLDRPRFRVQIGLREATPPSSSDDDAHDHDEESGEHDDDEPATTVDAGTPLLPTEIEILVGAETDGGAFAQVAGDPQPFVMPAELAEVLGHPLVDREIVAFDTSSATRVTLTVTGATVTLERRDGSWWNGAVPAAPDATTAFFERLRSLRARDVSAYGSASTFEARTSIVVEGDGGIRRLEIGEITGSGPDSRALARVSDVDVELELPGETVAALASYRP